MGKKERSGPAGKISAVLHTLRFQVMAIMVLCYLIPALLLGLFSEMVLLPGIREKTDAALTSAAEHAWALTVRNVEHAVALGREAIYDGELAEAYDRWRQGMIADAEYLRLSRAYMDRKYSRDDLFTFAVCFPVNRPEMLMYTRAGFQSAMTFLPALQQRVLQAAESMDTEDLFLQEDGEIYLVRNLLNLRMERYGVLVLGIRRDTMFAPLLEVAETWQGQLRLQLDGAGDSEPEFDFDAVPAGLSEADGEIRYVRRAREADYSLDLLLTLNPRVQYREYYQFRVLTAVVWLLLVPILGLLAWYVMRRIVRPITLLSAASRRMEQGELGVTVPMRGADEIGDLGRSFSHMSRRIEELIDKTYKEELALKNAQIQALQSRINPHFINNALEAINWEARMEKSETISAMVSALSVLLGASMARQDRRMVTLWEEIEVADAYIYFVQQRFGESLTVAREWSEADQDCMLPLLTIQPVLENAVEHGIAPAGGGEIAIRCLRMGNCLRIEIENTGRGMDPADREKIDAALRGDTKAGTHLGLANIADRLKLIYGGEAELTVFSAEDGRTVVRMEIPQQRID